MEHCYLLKSEETKGEGSSITELWRVLEPWTRSPLAGVSVLERAGKEHLGFSLVSSNCLLVPPIGKPNKEPANREVKMTQLVMGKAPRVQIRAKKD